MDPRNGTRRSSDRLEYREIIQHATQMLELVHDTPQHAKLSTGWYKRFLDRHPHLKVTKAQVLSKPRNAVDSATVIHFFHDLAHSASLVNMDPSRIFNMDETSFSPSKTSKKVVVHESTRSVHAEETPASAHVTIVACVAADGTKMPPLFVLPGDRVTTEACASLTIPGAALTTSEKGWTNSYICRKWLAMLSAHVPPSTERPILLIMDGCSSHYSEHIYAEAKALNILLQFLPANATHLFQPLDVTVFRPFKQAIRNAVADSIWTDVSTNINKQRAIAIACDVWANSTNEAAIINGFVCTGLCPISLDKMMRELVRGEVLLLPALKKRKTPARKTLTVSGKFITADYHELLQAQVAAKPKRKKKNSQEHVVVNDTLIYDFCLCHCVRLEYNIYYYLGDITSFQKHRAHLEE
ncbi:hypothetical protein AaE_014703 [Aphanomyces astaci]|uniref:DDE-1 domain-containing protein n=1 Tax=Aphanomyces astaci TaxID=112090 RepID=A0A6A4Z4C9_APHAT|nr:hypothetical protein AaE_014703 [Aphanomyces astaci]